MNLADQLFELFDTEPIEVRFHPLEVLVVVMTLDIVVGLLTLYKGLRGELNQSDSKK